MTRKIPPPRASPEDRREPSVTPFFARFLESPRAEAQTDPNTTGMTLKYPSDRDEIDFVD